MLLVILKSHPVRVRPKVCMSLPMRKMAPPYGEKKSGVVYEVPCNCGKVYIGETERTLETRMKEHVLQPT